MKIKLLVFEELTFDFVYMAMACTGGTSEVKGGEKKEERST